MPHRGRLNVLVNLLEYPLSELVAKIQGRSDTPESLFNCTDDVVSHVSCSNQGKDVAVQVSLLHNPSHLETSNAVSQGKTRAKQMDAENSQGTLNIQLHGDAAFSGQGVVYEALLLNQLEKYQIGGTIHLVVNNQVGYTTNPLDGRQYKYATEMAQAFSMPILHVNSNDVESCLKVVEFAMAFREKHHKDIMIDLNCYRKYGHNEVDELAFTYPNMYERSRRKQYTVYTRLIESLRLE